MRSQRFLFLRNVKLIVGIVAIVLLSGVGIFLLNNTSHQHNHSTIPNTPHTSNTVSPTNSPPSSDETTEDTTHTQATYTKAGDSILNYINCVGPDNKSAKAPQADCDNLLYFWDHHRPSSGSTTSSTSSNSSSTSSDNFTPLGLFGTSLSGLEFDGSFEANTQTSYTYFKNKGFNVIRLPFSWDELQPDLNGSFDSTAKGYLDSNIAWAKAAGLKIILDMHNYARRYVYKDGGFSDDFANSTQRTFRLPYGDHDAANATLTVRDFGRATAGTINNPVSPANSYTVTVDAKINSTSGNSSDQFYIDTYYIDNNNRYSFYINPSQSTWLLRKVISGTQTTLASGSHTWTLGQYYTFVVDVNQTTSGKINISVNGTPLFTTNSVNSDSSLTHGYVSFFPSGTNVTLKNFTLNVDGDTTSGGPIQQRVTDSLLPLSAWDDFWNRLSQAYKDDDTVIGYDQNEPHDMPIPTSTNNYSATVASSNGVSTATVTAIDQAMLDTIRANGDDKYIVAELDHWANTHTFTSLYGTNPTPWVIDSISPAKVIYSGHYYFDPDHSGTYSNNTVPTNSTVDSEVTPFFTWCNNREVQCLIGEYGVPNTSEWQPTLTHFLNLMATYHISSAQWAGGDTYSSITTLQPTSSFTVDRLQMTTISQFLNQ